MPETKPSQKPDAYDYAGILGVSLVVAGVAHWSPAAAMILAGLVISTFAYVMAK